MLQRTRPYTLLTLLLVLGVAGCGGSSGSGGGSADSIAAPDSLTATRGDKAVALEWSAVEGATGYVIYWGTEPDIHPEVASSFVASIEADGGDTTQHTVLRLHNGTFYRFVVTAQLNEHESEPSDEVTAMPREPIAETGEWRSHYADSSNTGRGTTAGPDDPGFKWLIDIAQVATAFAPAGYSAGTGDLLRPLVAPDGTLVYVAKNEEPQYDRIRYGREVIGIDPNDGNVIWEIGNNSTEHRRCHPAIDSRGRLWVHQGTSAGDWFVRAFDPATANALESLSFETTDLTSCRRTSLHIGGEGDNERLVLYGNGGDPDELLMLDISGDGAPTVVRQGIAGIESIAAVPGTQFNHQYRIGVFTDDALYLSGLDADETVQLLQVPLDGSTPLQHDLPTPNGSSAADYSSVAMIVADDGSLIVSPRWDKGTEALGYVAALDPDDNLAMSWQHVMPDGVRAHDLTHGWDAVIVHPGERSASFGGNALLALSLEDGSVVWEGLNSGSSTIADAVGDFYTSSRTGTMTRDRLIVSGSGEDGAPRWIIEPDTLAAAAGLNDYTKLGLDDLADLRFGPIDGDGTLYVTNGYVATGILAIDNSGGLSTAGSSD